MFEHRNRHDRAGSLKGVWTVALLLASAPVLGQTVYRHVDENGVVSFSDVETEGAETMTLEVSVPRESAFDAQQTLIDQLQHYISG